MDLRRARVEVERLKSDRRLVTAIWMTAGGRLAAAMDV